MISINRSIDLSTRASPRTHVGCAPHHTRRDWWAPCITPGARPPLDICAMHAVQNRHRVSHFAVARYTLVLTYPCHTGTRTTRYIYESVWNVSQTNNRMDTNPSLFSCVHRLNQSPNRVGHITQSLSVPNIKRLSAREKGRHTLWHYHKTIRLCSFGCVRNKSPVHENRSGPLACD